ncbi:MAG TPA: hypothetical protein VMI52_07605 [Acetobacteraceae bacterium]|nr:hypothetical protein [Acetobacteraceae bacterium]
MSENRVGDVAARLDAALERIARAAAFQAERAHALDATGSGHPEEAKPEVQEIAARLDALIADLREVLGTTAA